MTRVKRGKVHLRRRKALLKQTKGYRWRRKSSVKDAHTAVLKAGANAYVGRKLKKREYRNLWAIRLNAALRPLGMSYSVFIGKLKKNNIELDRKVMAQLAAEHPEVFAKIVESVK